MKPISRDRRCLALALARLDGELSEDEDLRYEEHLDDCPQCWETLPSATALLEDLAALPGADAPEPDWASVDRALDDYLEEASEPTWRERLADLWRQSWRPEQARQRLRFGLATAGAGAIAALLLFGFMGAPDAGSKAPLAPIAERSEVVETILVGLAVEGDVRFEQADSLAAATPMSRGQRVRAGDRITTGERSRVVLRWGQDQRLALGPGSSVVLASIDADGLSLRLREGELATAVRDAGVKVLVGGRKVSAVGALFGVTLLDDATYVSSVRGSARVDSTNGQAPVDVTEGRLWIWAAGSSDGLDLPLTLERRQRLEALLAADRSFFALDAKESQELVPAASDEKASSTRGRSSRKKRSRKTRSRSKREAEPPTPEQPKPTPVPPPATVDPPSTIPEPPAAADPYAGLTPEQRARLMALENQLGALEEEHEELEEDVRGLQTKPALPKPDFDRSLKKIDRQVHAIGRDIERTSSDVEELQDEEE